MGLRDRPQARLADAGTFHRHRHDPPSRERPAVAGTPRSRGNAPPSQARPAVAGTPRRRRHDPPPPERPAVAGTIGRRRNAPRSMDRCGAFRRQRDEARAVASQGTARRDGEAGEQPRAGLNARSRRRGSCAAAGSGEAGGATGTARRGRSWSQPRSDVRRNRRRCRSWSGRAAASGWRRGSASAEGGSSRAS